MAPAGPAGAGACVARGCACALRVRSTEQNRPAGAWASQEMDGAGIEGDTGSGYLILSHRYSTSLSNRSAVEHPLKKCLPNSLVFCQRTTKVQERWCVAAAAAFLALKGRAFYGTILLVGSPREPLGSIHGAQNISSPFIHAFPVHFSYISAPPMLSQVCATKYRYFLVFWRPAGGPRPRPSTGPHGLSQ
eukprot:scaffold22886_cov242-Isochrysis_galbana.AAC.2